MMIQRNEIEKSRAAVLQEIADGVEPVDLQAKIDLADLSELNARIKSLANQPVTSATNVAYEKALQESIVLRNKMA